MPQPVTKGVEFMDLIRPIEDTLTDEERMTHFLHALITITAPKR